MSNINLVNNGFPLAKISLRRGERIKIENGSMVYKSMGINLKTRLNASGSNGLTRFIKATARAAVSGESTFVTEAIADNDGLIAIAPTMPGHIAILQCGKKQYCINDGAFLALTGGAEYKMKSQGFGKAMFGGTGGFFVMETSGEGELLINSFGTLEKIDLNNDAITIDNEHVVAWDNTLNYDIKADSGFFESIGTGEGLVNVFHGTGSIYVQSMNLQNFVKTIQPHIDFPKG